jgi:ribosome-binding protein aMBF1 (putative translation factor)
MERNTQDWEPVVLRSKADKKNYNSTAPGKTIMRPLNPETQHLAKIEREEFVKPKVLTSESRQALIAARLALKKSQAELDAQCAFPKNTIREIEAGRLTPTGPLLNRLNRELKISLRLE